MPLSKAFFFLTAAATTVFIITILAMVAMLVGDPEAPVNLWFNDNGAIVMTVEVVAIGLFGMSAMIADRRETLRELKVKAKTSEAIRKATKQNG
jgi:hypothetical protein